MKIYKSFGDILHDSNSILTVGTFDGVHRGHQLIINRLVSDAKKFKLRPVILTLDPHPQIVLQENNRKRVELLSSIDERLNLFEKYGIEHTVVIPFSYEFSKTSPEDFIKHFLYEKIGLKRILIGYDHLFGRNRSGGLDELTRLSTDLNFDVEKINPKLDNGMIISSTSIREALASQNIEEANELLGYDYCLRGKVVHGDGRGSLIGYPTANIRSNNTHKMFPANGVYLVSAKFKHTKYYGMANIGTRPTFTDDKNSTLEINFFNLDEDLYGKHTTVSFHRFIRSEQKFSGVDDLLAQIKKDKNKCDELIEKFYL